VIQITDIYKNELNIETRRIKETSARLKSRDKKFLGISSYSNIETFLKKQRSKSSYKTVFRTTPLIRNYLLEVLVSLPHPFPFSYVNLSSKFGLLMFFRLYILFKVLKDYSTVYRKRLALQRIPGYSRVTHPSFDTFLSLKMIFYQYPIKFITTFIVATCLILAYCIYVFEREAQSWTFFISFYIIINSCLLGWGSDTFDEYTLRTWPGKILSLSGVVIGLFWLALLIDYVHSRMQPTRFQQNALQWVLKSNILEKERVVAARLIQLVWRHYQWKRKFKAKNISKNEKKLYTEQFTIDYLNLINLTRTYRRQKIKDFDSSLSSKDYISKTSLEEILKENRLILTNEFQEILENQKKEIIISY